MLKKILYQMTLASKKYNMKYRKSKRNAQQLQSNLVTRKDNEIEIM